MTPVIAAVISAAGSIAVGILSLVGVILTNSKSNGNIQRRMEINQAITGTKIAELTREVRLHNNYARRMPVIEEQIKVINHRIHDLEKNQMGDSY